ncbi:Glycosyltransferase involved in cell wall bisynthesis [Nitrosomonas marina]|uniref:Glycosyltransferase involved in cell wall bisynthesis n=1 Tax=Nitrosomonas marina TaxID=917 RepID=A0A1I0ESM0_9PROT|nr:DUF1972 domain-containing protein [Nitrosomonas marina]SET48420.1 Glycosyltransferase involved in cell wall bisynthesis [Nitrosomonas marina]
MKTRKSIRILGTRGIPAQHGGFETFAEHLALYLTRKGWSVTVYCQEKGDGAVYEDQWQDIKLVHFPINYKGAFGTISFDWKTTLHAARYQDGILTLGYNTAIFGLIYKILGLKNIINMDGLEWQRKKWSFPARLWLYLNERAGCWIGDHLIADHPEIQKHLATRVHSDKITMIPYGAPDVNSASQELLATLKLYPQQYAIVIARPEPENSILEIVTSFSKRSRGMKLIVLGNFNKANSKYRNKVFAAASSEVQFPGAIYDQQMVKALRFYAYLYIHGHQVGGTNPSLVEALGAGMPILAHDNRYNRWVAGEDNYYFSNTHECAQSLDFILENKELLQILRQKNRIRHQTCFTWESILARYEQLLCEHF